MKFKITSTKNKWFSMDNNGGHAQRMYLSYPEIKNKTKIINDKGELEIEIDSVEEFVKLCELIGGAVVLYKDKHFVGEGLANDDIYTIEIYDDYRE